MNQRKKLKLCYFSLVYLSLIISCQCYNISEYDPSDKYENIGTETTEGPGGVVSPPDYLNYEYDDFDDHIFMQMSSKMNLCDTKSQVCISKCCPEEQLFSETEGTCIGERFEKMWEPKFYNKNFEEQPSPDNLNILSGFPCEGFLEEKFYLLTNGKVYFPGDNRKVDIDNYCIENFYNDTHVTTLAFVCFPEEESAACREVKTSLLVVSCAFLALTFMIYIILPSLRNNLHGKMMISYSLTLLLCYISLCIMQFGASELIPTACKVIRK